MDHIGVCHFHIGGLEEGLVRQFPIRKVLKEQILMGDPWKNSENTRVMAIICKDTHQIMNPIHYHYSPKVGSLKKWKNMFF